VRSEQDGRESRCADNGSAARFGAADGRKIAGVVMSAPIVPGAFILV
jgi:hypothetical protein